MRYILLIKSKWRAVRWRWETSDVCRITLLRTAVSRNGPHCAKLGALDSVGLNANWARTGSEQRTSSSLFDKLSIFATSAVSCSLAPPFRSHLKNFFNFIVIFKFLFQLEKISCARLLSRAISREVSYFKWKIYILSKFPRSAGGRRVPKKFRWESCRDWWSAQVRSITNRCLNWI